MSDLHWKTDKQAAMQFSLADKVINEVREIEIKCTILGKIRKKEGNDNGWSKRKTERKQVQMSVKKSEASTEGKIWEEESSWGWKGRMMGWWMIIVVVMILVRWDDRGEKMNQEKTDQDVADEASEKVDSKGEAY